MVDLHGSFYGDTGKVYLQTASGATEVGDVTDLEAVATAAAASAAAALTALDSFDDRYLGAKASDPTLDNDGNALITGALYWNTPLAKMRTWSGAIWTDSISGSYLATTGGTMTGQLLSAVGTAGAPGIAGAGDADTGMNWPAANMLAWSMGGLECMRLNSVGLGIGTTSPAYTLDVHASGNVSGQFKTSGAINALFLADAGTTPEALYIGTVGDAFRVVTGSNENMRITSAGNVGIGTSSPGYKLDVSATGYISGQFKTSGSINVLFLADAGTTPESLYIGTAGNDFRVVTGSNENMRVTSAGNVGIGTGSPGYKLHVLGNFGIAPGVGTTVTPANNADLVIETTSNTTLTFKLKGSDGVVRTGTVTLA